MGLAVLLIPAQTGVGEGGGGGQGVINMLMSPPVESTSSIARLGRCPPPPRPHPLYPPFPLHPPGPLWARSFLLGPCLQHIAVTAHAVCRPHKSPQAKMPSLCSGILIFITNNGTTPFPSLPCPSRPLSPPSSVCVAWGWLVRGVGGGGVQRTRGRGWWGRGGIGS